MLKLCDGICSEMLFYMDPWLYFSLVRLNILSTENRGVLLHSISDSKWIEFHFPRFLCIWKPLLHVKCLNVAPCTKMIWDIRNSTFSNVLLILLHKWFLSKEILYYEVKSISHFSCNRDNVVHSVEILVKSYAFTHPCFTVSYPNGFIFNRNYIPLPCTYYIFFPSEIIPC